MDQGARSHKSRMALKMSSPEIHEILGKTWYSSGSIFANLKDLGKPPADILTIFTI